ncbi:STAS domain-containing protein [Silanimonas lenta]|uniref:STAS domain-containing protein n=1 Tax=Silanimonas lenta TaxID=265429 RepID=UPI00042746C9|nr:STAS domain-containing protein [Silanimonas lenta]
MPNVELSPEWGIEAAADLKARLAPHLGDADEVVLAAPAASRVHSASLQVLAAFFRSRRAAGRATRLEPCADGLRDAAVQLGIAAELGLAPSQP